MEHRNVYAADPNNPAELARAQEVFQRAVPYSNQAVQAEHEGRFEEAIRLHKLALEIKVRICGEASVQAAVTYNGLGECYLQTQNLDAAEQCLAKALMMLLLEAWDKAHGTDFVSC